MAFRIPVGVIHSVSFTILLISSRLAEEIPNAILIAQPFDQVGPGYDVLPPWFNGREIPLLDVIPNCPARDVERICNVLDGESAFAHGGPGYGFRVMLSVVCSAVM